jgi:hypothetical protein
MEGSIMYYAPRPGIDRYEYGDGLLGAIAKIGKAILRPIGNLVPKNTIFSKALQAVGLASKPAAVLTTAVALPAAAGYVGASMVQSGQPLLPGGIAAPQPAGGGLLPWWRGAGGKLQLPWSDPQQLLQPPYAYDDSYLRITYRAPRGYVVVKDPQGRRYAMARPIARSMGLWRASRKPPISAGDWHRYQAARSVEKKLVKLARHALHKRRPAANVVPFPKRKVA